MTFETIFADAAAQILAIFDPQSRVWAGYLLGSLVLAYVAYGHLKRSGHLGDDGDRAPGFLAFVFNKEVWLHRSTRQDFLYFLVNGLIFYGLIGQFLIGSFGLSVVFHEGLSGAFGPLDQPVLASGWSLVVYSLAALIALDLGVYLTHWAQHKIPLLWTFHQVHHSAERLTPLTVFRMHPVDLAFTGFIVAVLSAMAYAGVFYLSGTAPQALTVLGLNVFLFAFHLLGYNLRHSEVWLNYPGWLSRVLISPAQHQIHHSTDPKHFDRNLGFVFSLWDQLFGTYYGPKSYERLSFGLSREAPNPYRSVGALYLKPFGEAGTLLTGLFDSGRRKVILALLLASSGLVYGQIYVGTQHAAQAATRDPLPSVRLAELTWTEVQTAIKAGFDTVLIPTAGVEQNGPHLVLGKHNIVIDHASVQIAERLGNTLVLPVIDYVPEGDVGAAPTGHMRYAGTLSVPEDVFEQILEAAARSAHTHGFTNIFFLGDSLGNQPAQARVAERLQTEWANAGVRIAHISDYYDANGQYESLLARGYTPDQIGTHAGIRDTSEVLFVNPQAVRDPQPHPPGPRSDGVHGDPTLARAEIGEAMIALKVNAALAQIEQVLEDDWGQQAHIALR